MNNREKSRSDILGKIEQERQKRGWSELLDLWQKLSPEQRHNLILLLQSFHKDK